MTRAAAEARWARRVNQVCCSKIPAAFGPLACGGSSDHWKAGTDRGALV